MGNVSVIRNFFFRDLPSGSSLEAPTQGGESGMSELSLKQRIDAKLYAIKRSLLGYRAYQILVNAKCYLLLVFILFFWTYFLVISKQPHLVLYHVHRPEVIEEMRKFNVQGEHLVNGLIKPRHFFVDNKVDEFVTEVKLNFERDCGITHRHVITKNWFDFTLRVFNMVTLILPNNITIEMANPKFSCDTTDFVTVHMTTSLYGKNVSFISCSEVSIDFYDRLGTAQTLSHLSFPTSVCITAANRILRHCLSPHEDCWRETN